MKRRRRELKVPDAEPDVAVPCVDDVNVRDRDVRDQTTEHPGPQIHLPYRGLRCIEHLEVATVTHGVVQRPAIREHTHRIGRDVEVEPDRPT